MPGLIAIVGRPNVGKSALFNRLVGRRIAIVHDQPGVTRDRISAEAEWRGRPFTLVDTGGIGLLHREKTGDEIARAAAEQVRIAIEAAHVILFVVNVQEGLAPLDREVAVQLRQAHKAVIVVVNKSDNAELENHAPEFAELGFDNIFPVSAVHGRGMTALMNAALALLDTVRQPGVPAASVDTLVVSSDIPADPIPEPAEPCPVKIAIVGRPNVGKSSLINALTQSQRLIVSTVPGTTRDAVDVPFTVETGGARQQYVLIDTAGIRKKRRIGDAIEFFSVTRAEESIGRCDIAVLVMDAEAGLTEQDNKIADIITEKHKACVLVINKWDLVKDQVRKAQMEKAAQGPSRAPGSRRLTTLADFAGWVQERMFFLDYAPVIFSSAKSGFHLDRLLEAVRYVAAQLRQKVPTALLNRVLNNAIELRQPASRAGHRLKFFYATQIKLAPPTFVLFVNRDESLSPQYTKYLTETLRKAFGYEGCPIILRPRPRPKTIAPKRRPERGVKRGTNRGK